MSDCAHCQNGWLESRYGCDVECVNGVLIDIDDAHEGWDRQLAYPAAPCQACSACLGKDMEERDECAACNGTGWKSGHNESQERLATWAGISAESSPVTADDSGEGVSIPSGGGDHRAAHTAPSPTSLRPQDWITTALDGFFAEEGSAMPEEMRAALVAKMALACTGIQGETEIEPFERLLARSTDERFEERHGGHEDFPGTGSKG